MSNQAPTPQNFRYDQTRPPAGLKPTLNTTPPAKAPEVPAPLETEGPAKLPDRLEKRRLLLREEMRQVVAENVPISTEERSAPEVVPEQPKANSLDKYKAPLIEALSSPEMKSLQFGIIGTGQCGGRIAEQFARFGYQVVAINTAEQDLAFIDIPYERKLVLPYALGGAGKDLLVGQTAAQQNLPKIITLLEQSFEKVDQLVICTSGGGGSGAGSIIPLLQAIGEVEKLAGLPIVVIYALPMNDEGAQAKSNAVKTLDRIAKVANDDIISSIIIVDNAKIQEQYPSVSIKDFWRLANFDIVNPFNLFNTVSKCATPFDSLDPMDFANILATGGCLIYGKIELPISLDANGDPQIDEQVLAQALIRSAQEGTLAEGFDITQAIRVGVIVTGREEILGKLPAMSINYAFNVLAEQIGQGCTIYKGIYADDTAEDRLTVHTIFAGLGLPAERVLRLKVEAEQALQKIETKHKVKLTLDKDDTLTKSDPYSEMRQRNTPMGRMIDKRRVR